MTEIIYGVLETNNKTIFGCNGEKRFYPYNKNLPMFYVPTKKPFSVINIYCGITFKKQIGEKYYGSIAKYIGEIGNIDNELEYLKNIACAKWKGNSKLNLDDYDCDLTPIRKDLTFLNTYSIDPNNCVDIDDALSILQIDENKYKIFIHIADVSSFINQDTQLDNEIKNRIETIYLNKFQINMIPDKLSINKISLLSNKINRAFTLELIVVNNRITEYTFYKSVIKVNNLNYNECQKILKKNQELQQLYNIAKELYINKFGECLDFNTHHMVEIYMIIANSCAAKEILDHKYAIFRKHDIIKIMNPAIYVVNDNINSLVHTSLKEELYTHFTSPMRRYIDIIIHRILSNKFCGTNFDINYNNSFIEELNTTHLKIKKINMLSELYINIFSDTFKEFDIYNGIIIDINCDINNKNKLKIFVKNLGIMTIKTKDITKYNINQSVELKIAFTKLNQKKINVALLEQ